MLALLFLCLCSILYVAPCWILATRKNVAPAWYHWVIPFWNLFAAYNVGKGSLKMLFGALALFFVFGIASAFAPGIAMGLLMSVGDGFNSAPLMSGGLFFYMALGLSAYGVYLYAIWKWAKNISEMAGVDPMVLSLLLVVMPAILPIVCSIALMMGLISPVVSSAVSPLAFVLAWVAFLVIALRTPKVGYLADSA
ncbi:MAG: hypothetical protein ACERJ1_04775 [Halodesulfovibrio sp.]|uniref:hypothetical protein n=1 Tax=Halodesulfovibrio sp. TaxID=1912772 RepID=UPI00359CCDFA